MFGLLNLDKPEGFTSRDAVNLVQKLVRPAKVGHAGTLDPLATGVLLVCIGPATRLVPHLHAFSKTYVADFMLGYTSESEDTESELQPVPDATQPTASEVMAALPDFTGRIQQVPPAHSAVKVDGKRAYHLARGGQAPVIKPREVEIHRLELLELNDQQLRLEIECSSGTYIRSLGRDLGKQLGCGAVMSGLRRTRIGPFTTGSAIDPRGLTRETLGEKLLPARLAVDDKPQYVAREEEVDALQVGLRVRPAEPLPMEQDIAICDQEGKLIGLGELLPDGELAPRLVFEARHERRAD